MCRWIALISQEPLLLEDVLINAPHPITQQIHTHFIPDIPEGGDFDKRNPKYNLNGFGVTWYTNTRSEFEDNVYGPYPALYKTTALPTVDTTFTSICANTASKCFLAHLRDATRPPVAWTNNHPFVFGRYSFMHNGDIAEFPKVRLEILKKISPEYAAMIWGNTDTEHLAALYFTYLGDIQKQYSAREMRDALAIAIKEVQDIQFRVLGKDAPNNMNICITDGESLVALRWRNSPLLLQNPPSLYVSYNAIASLNRKHRHHPWVTNLTECTPEELTKNAKPASEQLQHLKWNPHGPHVIVASEPANFVKGEWSLLYNGQFILVDIKEFRTHWWNTVGPNVPGNTKDGSLENLPVKGAPGEMKNVVGVTFDYLEN